MSWSKFNDSFNNIKGQISTFIQEVVPEDDGDEPVRSDATIEQFQEVCTAQEIEIAALRRQVDELRGQTGIKQAPENATGPSSGGSISGAAQTLEDSWFWEADKNSSSSASSTKTTGNEAVVISKSLSGSDLTTIPLEQAKCKGATVGGAASPSGGDQASAEADQKQLCLENAVLREKNHQLQLELRETNENIEELDKQHNLIMETILDQKKELQSKFDNAATERDKLAVKFKQMADAKDSRIVELTKEKEELDTKFAEQCDEIAELRDKAREEPFVEVVDTAAQKEQHQAEAEQREKQCKVMELELEALRVDKKKLEEDFAASQDEYLEVQREFFAYKKQFNEEELREGLEGLEKDLADLKVQLHQSTEDRKRAEHEKDTLQADLINYEIECAELLKNNEKLLEELEQTKCGKLETIPEHSEESFTMLEGEYSEMSVKCAKLEAELKELKSNRSRLEETIQQLEFQLNEVRSNTSAEDDQLEEEMKQEQVDKLKAMEKELDSKNHRLGELEAELNASKVAIEMADKSLIMVQQELTDVQRENANSVTAMQQISEEKRSLEESLAQLKVDLETKTAAFEDQLETAIKKQNDDKCEGNEVASTAIAELQLRAEKQLLDIEQLNSAVGQLNQEKADLIALVTTKHQESVQYHAEVQRVSGLLQQMEAEKAKGCESCNQLSAELGHLQAKVERLAELESEESEQVHFLREKAGILTSNLLVEQNMKRLVQKEKEDVEKDLDRLRQHLMALEEEHTSQLMDLQRQMEEYRTKSTALESEAKHASTAYTSASIRANQQNETIQAQYKLLQQQRDDLSLKLSQAEDRESKNAAALVNLQCALEQFQNEKQRDIENALYLVRKEVLEEKQKYANLMGELQARQVQLGEAKSGLLAAARISDQLEGSQRMIADQKEEIRTWELKASKLEEKMKQAAEGDSDKVEKGLIKNLVVGYLTSPNSGKGQILKLLSAVLDFSPAEADRTGVTKNQSGWLGGLLHSGGGGGTAAAGAEDEGLAQAFVKFLEQESRPSADSGASLLSIRSNNPGGGANQPTTSDAGPENSLTQNEVPVIPQATLMMGADASMQQSFVPTRNSSSILKDVLNDS